MIGKLTGTIDAITEDGLLLDVNGVGYVVQTSAKTMTRLGGPGTPASLLIETQMREDAITLFGFADAAEREWFRLLRSVQGVGGKVALAILSTLTADDLTHAIAAQDKASVARANGVGPKLAQRVVSELKDKAAGIGLGAALSASMPVQAKAGEGGDLLNDAVSALVNLGYRRAEAYGAVSKVLSGAVASNAARPALNDLILGGLKELSQ
ncbi:MAG TPA: Holliday junction branch migration protein RuvA [Dongiaceae bacterium]